ncbi:branched-chain amino acid transporter permease [Bifidobacterium oedipodis]|uniref:Branched-chain amino acid permease n=1 Tax=Bifidobacterium oedipodis TaxID=2675322 RepID=A0A7Y0HRR2_9BIFI|nr:AzlD domain-containing protein [Bifidobacterium sp. DSM 109957]NMM93166.1 branched-chain amino acid permease [Bifidobacterium sp. DSM 109957]
MTMPLWQGIATVLAVVAGTILTRFIPFWLFPESKEPPRTVTYLGKVLPYAMGGLLIVYSLRTTNVLAGSHGVPELIALLITVGLHVWKRSMLLSIAAGTISYMLLVQLVF